MPEMITVDKVPKLIGKALDTLAYRHEEKPVFTRPGKPVDKTCIESFNGRLRDECLNMNWFTNTDHVREVIEHWRDDYQTIRPHIGLNRFAGENFGFM